MRKVFLLYEHIPSFEHVFKYLFNPAVQLVEHDVRSSKDDEDEKVAKNLTTRISKIDNEDEGERVVIPQLFDCETFIAPFIVPSLLRGDVIYTSG